MKKIISLVLVTVMVMMVTISVSAASGTRTDNYSAHIKHTFNFKQYSSQTAQNISVQLLEIIEGDEALAILEEGSRYNELPASDEQFMVYKFYIRYNKGPEKALDTSYIISRYSNWYDKSGKEVKINRLYPTMPDKYNTSSIELYPGSSATFYMPVTVKASVGYPIFKISSYPKELWFNTNPDFKESANSKVAVKSVKLNISAVTLNKGASFNVESIISPNNATNKNVKWKSSRPSVAVIDGKGRVTAKAKGTTTITATTTDGKKTVKCTVTVK